MCTESILASRWYGGLKRVEGMSGGWCGTVGHAQYGTLEYQIECVARGLMFANLIFRAERQQKIPKKGHKLLKFPKRLEPHPVCCPVLQQLSDVSAGLCMLSVKAPEHRGTGCCRQTNCVAFCGGLVRAQHPVSWDCAEGYYVWRFQLPSSLWNYVGSAGVVVVTIGCCLFPLSPHWVKARASATVALTARPHPAWVGWI